MFVKLFFRPEKYIYTFISDSRFETILKHLKLVWHLNSHMYFKVHKTFNCVDIFILLQTNLHIDITSSFIVTYYIFINPFGPIVYYSPKNTPINKMPFYLIKSKCLVFLNFFDESVRLKLLMSHCFQAQENWPKDWFNSSRQQNSLNYQIQHLRPRPTAWILHTYHIQQYCTSTEH